MSVEDFRINAFVRELLGRFWVDFQGLRYGTVGGTVYLHGRFEKVRPPESGGDEPIRPRHPVWTSENLTLLEAVEREIRREPLVQDVVFRLENFRKIDGKWVSSGA
jgi:hypothetical protein